MSISVNTIKELMQNEYEFEKEVGEYTGRLERYDDLIPDDEKAEKPDKDLKIETK